MAYTRFGLRQAAIECQSRDLDKVIECYSQRRCPTSTVTEMQTGSSSVISRIASTSKSVCARSLFERKKLERESVFCSARDLAGFTFGMASIVCWLVAQVPQFITNIKRQRADALSPWFLAEWLLVSTSTAVMANLPHRRQCNIVVSQTNVRQTNVRRVTLATL